MKMRWNFYFDEMKRAKFVQYLMGFHVLQKCQLRFRLQLT